jgi:hypothetical protein
VIKGEFIEEESLPKTEISLFSVRSVNHRIGIRRGWRRTYEKKKGQLLTIYTNYYTVSDAGSKRTSNHLISI